MLVPNIAIELKYPTQIKGIVKQFVKMKKWMIEIKVVDPDPDSMTLWIRIEFGIRIHGQEK
jgi:hypothetical protein